MQEVAALQVAFERGGELRPGRGRPGLGFSGSGRCDEDRQYIDAGGEADQRGRDMSNGEERELQATLTLAFGSGYGYSMFSATD
jgi:hypothetical protein